MSPRHDHRKPAVAFAVLFVVALLVLGNGMRARAVGGSLQVAGRVTLDVRAVRGVLPARARLVSRSVPATQPSLARVLEPALPAASPRSSAPARSYRRPDTNLSRSTDRHPVPPSAGTPQRRHGPHRADHDRGRAHRTTPGADRDQPRGRRGPGAGRGDRR